MGLSARNHVLSLRTFLSLGDSESYFLTFGQSLEAAALDRAVMHEYVWAVALSDEAEAFGFVKKFNLTAYLVRHDVILYFKKWVLWDRRYMEDMALAIPVAQEFEYKI